jgi:hypothetical protein
MDINFDCLSCANYGKRELWGEYERVFGRKPKALVVDDEHVVADSLAWILNLTGFTACSLYSGRDAIDHAVVTR